MGWISSPSAPPAPNYAALAQQSANSQNQQLDRQTSNNRPNQYTPWGSSTWARKNVFDQAGWDQAQQAWSKASQGATPGIDWNRYATDNPDIAGSGMTPQQHYERYGKNEGRQVSNTAGGISQPRWNDFNKEEWTQNVNLDPAEQAQLDQQRRIDRGLGNQAEGLLGQAANSLSNPLNTNGLPPWMNYDMGSLQGVDPSQLRNGMRDAEYATGGDFNLSASGNSKEIQDATYNLLSPQRQRERAGEIQRLKNQGLTEDSPAFQRAMERVDEGDTRAQMQSLLAGQAEYGNMFARAMGQNQQNFGQRLGAAGFNNQVGDSRFGQNLQQQNLATMLRGQQFGEQGARANLNNTQRGAMLQEQQAIRQSPLNDLRSLMGGPVSNPQFANFMGAGQGQGVDYTGAGNNQYQAQMNQFNAQQAQQSNMMSGLFGLGGAALAGPAGAKAGSFLGGLFGP